MSKSKQYHVIYTIGHSTRSIEEFIELLKQQDIARVIDIRTIPRSRHNPQFNEDALEASLKKAGILYTHLKELGGLRHSVPNSINQAWHNLSFRGFADYMQTEDFKKGLDFLIALASHERVVLMCAEAVPWKCHRSLIGDALLARGLEVVDIFSLTSIKPHALTPWAHVHNGHVTYPG